MLSLLGLLALMLAGVDAVIGLFGLSLLAVAWSPAILGVLGLLFLSLEALANGDRGA